MKMLRYSKKASALLLTLLFLLSACTAVQQTPEDITSNVTSNVTESATPEVVSESLSSGVWYEIFSGSFNDSNGDGTGDLRGIIEKLDYLSDDLNISGIWLTPIFPSPTYHKYDTTDYYNIDPEFGTMEDFEELIAECDKRGIAVILDLMLNHSSSQHPWFLSAKKSVVIEPCGQNPCSVSELCREHNPYVGCYNFERVEKGESTPKGWYTFSGGRQSGIAMTRESQLITDGDGNPVTDEEGEFIYEETRRTYYEAEMDSYGHFLLDDNGEFITIRELDPEDIEFSSEGIPLRIKSAEDVRIETWRYEADFWDGMPDFNMDSREMRLEVERMVSFWLSKGIAGFRLDAVKHIYDDRPRDIEFLKWFDETCKRYKRDTILIGEVWSGEGEVLAFYESGITGFFNFPFAGNDGAINSAVKAKDGASMSSALEQFTKNIEKRNPDGVHVPFLSNHDTDRSAEYITDPDMQKLQAAVYLLMPGMPFMYYGEEIGESGKKSHGDEALRLPMPWDEVERQLSDPNSLLNYYRAVLELRTKFTDIHGGEVKDLKYSNRRVCAYQVNDTAVLHNFSDESQEVDISGIIPGMKLLAFISPSGAETALEGTTLTLAPYMTVIMKYD